MANNLFGKKLIAWIFSVVVALLVMSCSSEKYMKDRILGEVRNAEGNDISIDLNQFSKEK